MSSFARKQGILGKRKTPFDVKKSPCKLLWKEISFENDLSMEKFFHIDSLYCGT